MDKKIFVNSDLTANFVCPECGKSRQMDVSKFIGHEKKVKLNYKCKCGHAFSVILERRRSIRKKHSLKGFIIKDSNKYAINIEDISKHGVRLKILKKFSVKQEDRLEIEFVLDDPNLSKVLKNVRVKKIYSPADIGCEFDSLDHYDSLGKYFLFYF